MSILGWLYDKENLSPTSPCLVRRIPLFFFQGIFLFFLEGGSDSTPFLASKEALFELEFIGINIIQLIKKNTHKNPTENSYPNALKP